MSTERSETNEVHARSAGKDHLDFMSRQVFVIDPRGQGLGLKKYDFLDSYANKFFILAGRKGVFISPKTVPDELITYYKGLGIDIPDRRNVLAIGNINSNMPLKERVRSGDGTYNALTAKRGSFIVPYMATEEVEMLANQYGLSTLQKADAVSYMADKANFQTELAKISPQLFQDFGYDMAISLVKTNAGDEATARRAYADISHNQEKGVVLVKPKSASGLGIFEIKANAGEVAMLNVLKDNFAENEVVLFEEYVDHNYSPSMQGASFQDDKYRHMYFGKQIILRSNGRVEYDASQLPFGPVNANVQQREVEKMEEIHESLGIGLMKGKDIAGVGGFDALVDIAEDGHVRDLKFTELNLHLPSTLAVFAAVNKVFPDGFNGIAHNLNVPLSISTSPVQFMAENAGLLLKAKGEYGVFPLNLSYSDKVDLVVFGKNQDHVDRLLESIKK